MLSLFPQLLFLAPLGTTALRVVAGFYFLYAGYRLYRDSEEIERGGAPLIGHPRRWMLTLGALVSVAIGALFVVGLWTQAVAVVGALGALKFAAYARWYNPALPFSPGTGLLLFVVSLALLVSGAGLWGFDLPL